MAKQKKIAHIVVAAGSGSRYGGDRPKQFCDLDGRPLLMTTVERLRQASPEGSLMVLVLSTYYIDEWIEMCREHSFPSPPVVEGGSTRWESVRNALDAIPASVDVISVHDGARPVLPPEMVRRVLRSVGRGYSHGVIPVVDLTDSVRLRRDDAPGGSMAFDRSRLMAVQTPQAFNARMLRRAYSLPYSTLYTDDASVMEAGGYDNIITVEGDHRNIKVTRPGDMEIASLYLKTLPR